MIRFDDVHAIRLIATAARIQFVPQLHHCIADYDANDRLKGGTLYTDYHGGACQVHFAGFRKGWISKSLLWLGFDYPFNQLKVKKIVGPIPEWNVASRNMALHLGFKIEYKVDDIYNHPDGVNGLYITSMTRESCRWLDIPMPLIDYAPPERINRIDIPLEVLPTLGGVH